MNTEPAVTPPEGYEIVNDFSKPLPEGTLCLLKQGPDSWSPSRLSGILLNLPTDLHYAAPITAPALSDPAQAGAREDDIRSTDTVTQPAPGDAQGETCIYVASKVKHAPMWRRFRDAGAPIISTWINEAGEGQTNDYKELASRCVREVQCATSLVLYCEHGEILKGAIIEAGVALAAGIRVYCAGDCESISRVFRSHPLWTTASTVDVAIYYASEYLPPRPTVAGQGGTPESADEIFERIRVCASMHYIGGAYDPEHMRAIANVCIQAMNKEPQQMEDWPTPPVLEDAWQQLIEAKKERDEARAERDAAQNEIAHSRADYETLRKDRDDWMAEASKIEDEAEALRQQLREAEQAHAELVNAGQRMTQTMALLVAGNKVTQADIEFAAWIIKRANK